jgi:hypothetical protein
MKRLNCAKIRLVLAGFVAAIVLCGGSAKAEIIMSEPVNLGPVINDAYNVQECDFSHDGLQLYFAVWGRPDGFGSGDIYMAERATLNSPWEEPVNLGSNVNSSGREIEPSISGDGLELYFGSWDDYILRVCTRPSKDAPWGSPVKIGPPVGSDVPAMEIGSNDAWSPDISADGLSLYFSSTRVGGFGDGDIWVAKRATKDDPWGEPVNLGPNVNTYSNDWSPNISTDGLTLAFSRGFRSVWITTRKSVNDDWGPAVQLGLTPPPGQWNQFFAPALSPDGTALYFRASLDWGGFGEGDFWQVKFIPVVDFNGDGIVDIADLVALIEHWGEEDPLYDIGPLPLGDGIVDEADLKVFMSHWGQEAYDPILIAYWKLDETEGDIAYDSINDNHGIISGNPTWQPAEGKIDGALEFDGIDDYANAGFVLNPSSGPFSVYAWIKGGAAGQAILSQENGANWLMADPVDGALQTDLKEPVSAGRDPKPPGPPLISPTVVTDGDWHRVGFVRDGINRILYVDNVEVARDTAANLESAVGGLYIGAGSGLEPGTFWAGLIDDVRIYNKALSEEQIAALAQ